MMMSILVRISSKEMQEIAFPACGFSRELCRYANRTFLLPEEIYALRKMGVTVKVKKN
jgi:hypothetical protein